MSLSGAPAAALPGAADTIVAIATPPGRGALSIVRGRTRSDDPCSRAGHTVLVRQS